MSDISALGLGLMGSALARSLVGGGNSVTVWNRSPARMQPLVDMGAAPAASVAAAVEASPVVLVNIDDYPATRALFEAADVVENLSGRVVVQLSTALAPPPLGPSGVAVTALLLFLAAAWGAMRVDRSIEMASA